MIRRPKKSTGGTSTPSSSSSSLPLHDITPRRKASGTMASPSSVSASSSSISTNSSSSSVSRSSVVWYVFNMVVLLCLGSSLIVLVHTVTHHNLHDGTIGVVSPKRETPKNGFMAPLHQQDNPKVIQVEPPIKTDSHSDENRNAYYPKESDDESNDEPQHKSDSGDGDGDGNDGANNNNHPPKSKPTPKRKARTTAEANAYMRSQPSTSVDGEKHLKQQLQQLYDLQSKGLEAEALITTRFLGYEHVGNDGQSRPIKYWMSNSASDEEKKIWKEQNVVLVKQKKEEDKRLFPSLFGDGAKERAEDPNVVDQTVNDTLRNMDGSNVDSKGTRNASNPSNKSPTDSLPNDTNQHQQPNTQIKSLPKQPITNSDPKHQKHQKRQYPSPAQSGTTTDTNTGSLLINHNSHVLLQPTIGQHRSHVDAVFAFAEGYDLKIYLGFIESLRATGFKGDLVLSVSALGSLKPGVEEYLRSFQTAIDGNHDASFNVVVYTVQWQCYTGDGKLADGANEGIRKCNLVGMYGDQETGEVLKDPRIPRPVATARYELYWAWSLRYDPHVWLMLIDSRDTYFQVNPFEEVKRHDQMEEGKVNEGVDEGILYFFAENAEASTIGTSKWNKNWLITAYGQSSVSSFFSNPIICSGSTMGETVALESYLRAMVHQFDTTKCVNKGCDQGFHNYLHYSRDLEHTEGIEKVVVFEQGKGIINNLGVLRNKPLRERGLLNDEMTVLNWDGSISYVAHQFDRDDELNKFVKDKRQGFLMRWKERREKNKQVA